LIDSWMVEGYVWCSLKETKSKSQVRENFEIFKETSLGSITVKEGKHLEGF